MGFTSLASEFPNDNAAISSGAIWVGTSLTGPAQVELARYEPVPIEPYVLYFDDDDGYVEGPVDIQISEGNLAVVVVTPAPPTVEVAFEPQETRDQGALAVEVGGEAELELDFHDGEALIHAEETCASERKTAETPAPAFVHFEAALSATLLAQSATRSAAIVPRLLRLEPVPVDAVSKEVLLTLQSRGYLDSHGRYSAKFKELCSAWAAVLTGVSQDFGACGTTTLDRFGADLLAALLAVPATRSDELRRELRKAGIAAFGVLEAA